MAHPHGSRTLVSLGTLSPAQVEAGLREVFIKEMRADVERSRNLVRVGMSGVALAGGVEGAQMSTIDDRAYQALTHNAIPLVAYVGGAALEAAMPGLLAAAAGALGVTYAWDAVTGLFSASADQVAELPFNTTNDKLPVKGKASQGAPAVGQSTAGGMMPEDPDHENRNDDRPEKSKPEKKDLYDKSKKDDFVSRFKEHVRNLGARDGKPKNATTMNAAEIEARGGQIELAKQRGVIYDHGKKVNQTQRGLLELEGDIQKHMDHLKHVLRRDITRHESRDIRKYYKSLERLKDNVRNKFEITHKRVPYNPNNIR